jgi:hypothetical protein
VICFAREAIPLLAGITARVGVDQVAIVACFPVLGFSVAAHGIRRAQPPEAQKPGTAIGGDIARLADSPLAQIAPALVTNDAGLAEAKQTLVTAGVVIDAVGIVALLALFDDLIAAPGHGADIVDAETCGALGVFPAFKEALCGASVAVHGVPIVAGFRCFFHSVST